MKDLLSSILTKIVDHPEALEITETTAENHTILTIHAHQEDMGKIIGRGGRIIRAIRDIVKILAAKEGSYVDVEIAEDQNANIPETATESK